ncbi:hypothetical protein L2E82_49264 [Cichorium intybus]|uniref:Uncharacterized protein n=1 Tax=Cichorium intybus TaxID=13427 RepID=A0ACB8Z197_CICIN|nr:hypothetical protein L2E82_49264 [Cichorium intybus]
MYEPHKPVENGDQIEPSTPAKEVESTNKSSHETTPSPHKLVQGSDKLGSVNRVDSGSVSNQGLRRSARLSSKSSSSNVVVGNVGIRRKRKVANLGNGEAPGVINGSGSFTHTEIEKESGGSETVATDVLVSSELNTPDGCESDVMSVPDLGDKEETPTMKKVKSQRVLSRDVQFMGSESVQEGDAGNKRLNLRSGKKLSKPGVNNVAKDKELSSSQDEKELEDGESETVFNGGEKTLRRFKTRATTLTGLHFVTITLMTIVLRWLGYIQPSHLPVADLLKFVLFANFSIVGMNVSLMWNSVGFYQIAKLSMIPAARKSASTTGGVTKPHRYRPGTVALSEKSSLIANSKLHGTLYGFIVFEVGWKDVRAINYLNELQILKEEVRDLLDNKSELTNGLNGKVNSPGKPPVQIRETCNGVLTLDGYAECSVKALKEMSDCLEHGSLSRATGSTNMNNQSRPMHEITFSTDDKPKLLTQLCPSRCLVFSDLIVGYVSTTRLIHSDVIIHGRPEFEPVSPTTDDSFDGLVPSTSPKQQPAQRPIHEITFSTDDKPKLLTQVIALNEKFPSPTLNVTTNYNIVVNVKKKLDESLLITWSGIEKRRTYWQDGVLGTNCSIPTKWNWTYRLQFDYKTSQKEQQHSPCIIEGLKKQKISKEGNEKGRRQRVLHSTKLCESNRQRIQVSLFSTASSTFIENG